MGETPEGNERLVFWAIGLVALIWNGLGLVNLAMQMTQAGLAAMPQAQRAIAELRPLWATGAFAVAVGGGTLGAVLLMLRKAAAVPVLGAALLGTIAATAQAIGLDPTLSGLGMGEIVLTIAMPLLLAGFVLWYARSARSKGWIS